MKPMIGLLAMMVLVAGCAQLSGAPKNALDRYEEVKAYSKHATLSSCSDGNSTFYLVGADVEVDGPRYYYDNEGNENQSLSGLDGYRCGILQEFRS